MPSDAVVTLFRDGARDFYRMGPRATIAAPDASAAMRIKVLAWSVVTLAAVALAIWAAAWLFSQEDAPPARCLPGHVLAGTPCARGERGRAPDYFGSVGDGDKAPRGVTRCRLAASMTPPRWTPICRAAAAPPGRRHGGGRARDGEELVPAEYLSGSGELVVLAVSRTADPADGYRITLTHWD